MKSIKMFWILSKNPTINDLLTGNILSDLKAKIELAKKRNQENEQKEECEPISEVTISMISDDMHSSNFYVVQTSLPDTASSKELQHESEY